MLAFIYCLKNPHTQEVFYIGCTEISLKERLRCHYQHLKEAQNGKRKFNKRFHYLSALLPYKAKIELLEVVTSGILDDREKHYINIFRCSYPNLTNMTDGGKGNNTFKYQTDIQKHLIGQKISTQLIGKRKPDGFAKALSNARTGIGNTRAGTSKYGWIACFNHEIPIRMFKYGFEINSFIGSRSAFGNVIRTISKKPNFSKTPYHYTWLQFDDLDKDLQEKLLTAYDAEMEVKNV